MAQNYVMLSDDHDPAMRFEGLARTVFQCAKYGDPFRIAAQDTYNGFVGGISEYSRRALAIVLIKMAFDAPDNEEIKDTLNRVWEATNQEQIVDIIDDAIKILQG